MPGLPALDFLDAVAAKERTAEVRLGGETIIVPRARLGLHLRLLVLLEDASPEGAYDYVALASGREPEVEELEPAYAVLKELNQPISLAPILRLSAKGPPLPPALRYRGRGIAAIVNELAGAYGWTADYILAELGPEEAWCYLQEVQITRHDERRFLYGLSSVGRDKRGRQQGFPGLPWLKISAAPQDARRRRRAAPPIPAQFMPTGTIITFERRSA